MQTIRITITGDKPAKVVMTEKKPEEGKEKKKKTHHEKLEALLSQVHKEAILAIASEADGKSMD